MQDRALSRFVELGQNTAEYHLLMGKAFLNREENDKALAELEQAAQSDPNLPFVHFNLGLVYLARLDFDRAKEQFEKDIALEPDVAFNYDRLGLVYIYQQQDRQSGRKLPRSSAPRFPSIEFVFWFGARVPAGKEIRSSPNRNRFRHKNRSGQSELSQFKRANFAAPRPHTGRPS